MTTPNDRRPLDATDRAILRGLLADARVPNNALASSAGVAPSTCLARVQSLREDGVLLGAHTDVDLPSVGLSLQALISVRLTLQSRRAMEAFVDAIATRPLVVEVFFVSGTADYLIHVAAPDSDAIRDFVLEELSSRPEVAHTETSLVFEHRRGNAAGHALQDRQPVRRRAPRAAPRGSRPAAGGRSAAGR